MIDTKKPAPSQQESSAATAKKCSIEGCGGDLYPSEGFYCCTHEEIFKQEWNFCPSCPRHYDTATAEVCYQCGGQDYTPRTREDHPSPAPPEAKPCGDGNQEITPFGANFHAKQVARFQSDCREKEARMSIAEELAEMGVPPMRYMTEEERAVDLERWRGEIEKHRKDKEATK